MTRPTHVAAAAVGAALLCTTSFATPSSADSDACRDWRVEHRDWKIEALQAFLRGRPRAAQDETLFEVLQREAYLTSCDPDLRATRSEMVGWRLVGRSLDEYPAVLAESVLAASGFDLELRRVRQELERMNPPRATGRRAPRSWERRSSLRPMDTAGGPIGPSELAEGRR